MVVGILFLNIFLRFFFCIKVVSWFRLFVRVGDGGLEFEEMDDEDGEGG